MRHHEKNAALDGTPRVFSLEEAFLTRKNYKVIFCMTLTLSALRTALFLPMFLGVKLTEWEVSVVTILFYIMLFILDLIFLLIPVAFVVRVIFTHLLKKKIAQLEQVIWKRIAATYRQTSA
ncbi:hypothetical protein MNL13_06500 [Bartonella krasnovii]|uniref:Uncharacterized protein n=1 Tax=Bartonella krasnovii TaxID=2267275 RepID=A0A5B9D2V5_9HYPH|nr:hypothetical protein [Bartonella krasnovii]QEE12737.1 hypothetical protein D1092_07225 [Bartonella krasnovii]UNF28851.1 hypothetical protein MNL13_06500 [Bartonella krasnovii]UNF35221.1 hypothetical protein MNL12_06485 [Bartonella krasnovii]UNF36848.1 hypothetical protein MNL11_07155 [Bartonella krasnovii]UNF40262.1 hypothetical protein MNL09_07425 [Bartonella krasnovii]